MWNLEFIGITPVEKSVLRRFKETLAYKNGRYEVSLSWKDEQVVPKAWIKEMTTQRTSYKEAQKNVPILKVGGHAPYPPT